MSLLTHCYRGMGIYTTSGTPQSPVGGGLLPMAAWQPTWMLEFDRVHIRYLGNGHYWFRPYMPHHSAPRFGSVCPNPCRIPASVV
ncbi:hypothetical protein QFZ45_004487 [Pseudomonas synxantha]|nr:hypothetical protein [Pseudomonas synxantha]